VREEGPLSRLRVENLRFQSWGPIDLTVEASECVCLSGPSGSGKTLLLRSLADLDDHDGHTYLDGVECQSIPGPAWRRMVGLLPSESQWWEDTVGSHFDGAESRWLEMLLLPGETMDWQVQRLSTGERQRLALVRLLANRPKALLLDEPTASLDPEGVRRAEEVIAAYREESGAPILWVSHDPGQIARVADRHFQIQDGRLIQGARG
jgi:ABC-type multidrug transport system ATPase subunit